MKPKDKIVRVSSDPFIREAGLTFKVSSHLRYRLYPGQPDGPFRWLVYRVVFSSRKRWCPSLVAGASDAANGCLFALLDADKMQKNLDRVRIVMRQEVAKHKRKNGRRRTKK